MSKYIKWFEEIGLGDVSLVGGKNASLGEMVKTLSQRGIRVPGGFCVTADAYDALINQNGIAGKIKEALGGLDKNNVDDLHERGQLVRGLIRKARLPQDVADEIVAAYKELSRRYGTNVDVAVRSSGTAEDLPDASFAGQQETFLNIRGEYALIESCLDCFASLFTDRAIAYREDMGFDHFKVRLSIGVQKMVRSDLATAGVIFTIDPETGFKNVVLVTSVYGLGENIVAGRVDPDEFLVFKPTLVLDCGYRPILRRKVGGKQFRMVYSGHGTRTTSNVDVLPEEQRRLSLTDDEVLQLARWAIEIEDHYSRHYGRHTPMDIEWAQDGIDGEFYIVQARPETVHSANNHRVVVSYRLEEEGEALLSGRAIGNRIGAGSARVMKTLRELNTFKDGEVLVADMTDPDWEPLMKRASAIVTNRGGRTCHAAIVSRELGIPCIVGTERATEVLKDGQGITVSCAQGDAGVVYKGILEFGKSELKLDELPQTRTRIYVNLGNPDKAFALSSLPVDGVGLARQEFIIADQVKVHPMAVVKFDEIEDAATREQVRKLTSAYVEREEYYVDKLSEGVGVIAAAFYPKPVIVRLSDFKSNEYANLLGGHQFEEREENPMIGLRGASRYYNERFREAFALECRALERVRKTMGLTNLKIMVPFCRTVDEGKKVIDELRRNGLVQGEDGLQIFVMCELPANVFAVGQFAKVFDGFSIGSNDLTQLVLGLDRDSALVASLFDERNEAVKSAIAQAIRGAKRAGRTIGICGQAPSDFPEIVRFLVEEEIDSMSLNEDAVINTLRMVAHMEWEMFVAK